MVPGHLESRDDVQISEFKLCSMGMLAGGYYSQGGGGGESKVLDTVINATNDLIGQSGHPNYYYHYGYGFDAGADYYSNGNNFGSITDDTYTDAASNSRTVASCYWVSVGGAGADAFYFVLNGTGITNSDDTFSKIVVGTTTFYRNEALPDYGPYDVYNSSINGGTAWGWNSVNPNPFNVGNTDFEVWAG